METVCPITTDYFAKALIACVKEYNETRSAGQIRVLSQDDGLITFALTSNLVATVRFSAAGENTAVEYDYRLTAGQTGESQMNAKIAARGTVLLLGGGALYAAVWGCSYLIGNRNPWLPLLATGCLWACQVIRLLTSRNRAKKRFDRLMSDLLQAGTGND